MRKQFGEDKIIILLGAGASCDAGMKNSIMMIRDIEAQLHEKWKKFKDLYNYIQSSHYHLERIRGVMSGDIIFNIEHLVGLLNVIINIAEKKVEVYPFIGSWEKELYLVSGSKLELAKEFKEEILTQLKTNWLIPDDYRTRSSYYKKLLDTGYNFPLRIFSLNYDMCVEANVNGNGILLERGFNENRKWDYRRYEPNEEGPQYYLYKLHGSLDWKRDNEKRLTYADSTDSVNPLEMEIIFGVQNKLQSYDPYMYNFYAFREACIKAELIIISGYGFYDQHINDNLISAFKNDSDKRLIVNVYETNTSDENIANVLSQKLGINNNNITVVNTFAKDFFNEKLNIDYFSSIFPNEDAEIDVLPQTQQLEDKEQEF
ncbi:SIR2 family protein [Chitinophaga hostae]|uniref:SIR2 family protein n=1 Tax=Chitinophaga hostae TaxID=2831022 RepID=UPI003F69E0E9